MKIFAGYIKLNPIERVQKTNEFLKLLINPTKDPRYPNALSVKEKSELYGIEVKPDGNLFDVYYMKETHFMRRW